MKNKNYDMKVKKHKLRNLLNKSGDFVVWAIRSEQITIYENFGYKVEPYLYWIYPNRSLYKNSKSSKIIKDVHYKMKGRNTPFAMKLNVEEVKTLQNSGYRVTIYKYKITKR